MTAADYYRDLFLDMLPPGAFSVDPDGIVYALATGIGSMLARAEESGDALAAEALPHTADQMLPEWERLHDAPSPVGATVAERRAALVGLWRLALPATLAGLRAILADTLNPEYLHRDEHDDGAVSARYRSDLNACTASEVAGPPAELHLEAAGGTDARWTDSAKLRGLLLLDDLDPSDDVWVCAYLNAHTLAADDCGVGLVAYQDDDNAVCWGVLRSGGVSQIAGFGLEGNDVFGPASAAAWPGARWLILGREGSRYTGYLEASLPAPFDVSGLTPLMDRLSPVRAVSFGYAAKNDGAGQALGQWAELRVAYRRQENNVEIIEYPVDLVVPGQETDKYTFFVHRHPGDAGDYRLGAAQRLLDRAKHGHTLGMVGESDCFRADDPHSLTDRDILGS